MTSFQEIESFLARHRGAHSLFLCKLISACWKDASPEGRLQAAIFALILECCQHAKDVCALKRNDAVPKGKRWELQVRGPGGRLVLPSLTGILLDDWLRIRPPKPDGPLFSESASSADKPMTLEKLQQIFALRMKQAENLTTVDDFRVVASQINYGISKIRLKAMHDAQNRPGNVSLTQAVAHGSQETFEDRVSSPHPSPEEEAAIREARRAYGLFESRQKGAAAFERAEQDGRISQALGEYPLTADQRYVMALLLFTNLTQTEIADMRAARPQAVDNIKHDACVKLRTSPFYPEIEARLEEKKRCKPR